MANRKKPYRIGTFRNRHLAGSCQFCVNDAGTCAQIDTKLAQRCSRRVLFEQRLLPAFPSPPIAIDIFPTDHGEYGIGLDGPTFPSRKFAETIRLRVTRHAPQREHQN